MLSAPCWRLLVSDGERMVIVAQELLVLSILHQPREAWLTLMTARRQDARDDAARQGLRADAIASREEHAMLPPWLVNACGFLVLGLDDGCSRPSFCGDIYLKRKLFPKSKAARIIVPERRYERGLEREHMLHWAETGRFDTVADVIGDCEDRLKRHALPHGKQKRRPLKSAVVWRSPLVEAIDWTTVMRKLKSRSRPLRPA